jgi:hypothetical protein
LPQMSSDWIVIFSVYHGLPNPLPVSTEQQCLPQMSSDRIVIFSVYTILCP